MTKINDFKKCRKFFSSRRWKLHLNSLWHLEDTNFHFLKLKCIIGNLWCHRSTLFWQSIEFLYDIGTVVGNIWQLSLLCHTYGVDFCYTHMERYWNIPTVSNFKDNGTFSNKGKQKKSEAMCPLYITFCDLDENWRYFGQK